MKQKLLKLIYIIDGIVLILNLAYFSMVYLSTALQWLADAVNSHKLSSFQSALQDVVEFGVYYEVAVGFLFFSFAIILVTAIFSAVFFRFIISKTTYLLMVLSPLPVLLPYFFLPIAYLFVRDDICVSDPASGICFMISLIIIVIYTVFTGIFMCKDLKSFSALKA